MKSILLFLLCFLVTPLQAASSVWKVESASTTLFLAGTVHVLRDSDYPLPAAFGKAYQQAQQLVFEVDIQQAQSPTFQQSMAEAARLPPGTRLQDILQPETLKKLRDHLESKGMQLSQFEGLKPSIIATTLTMMELRNIGVSNEGVDAHFYLKAQRDGKKTSALETSQQQISYLLQMGEDNEDLMILQTLEEVKSLKSDFSDMLDSWRSGDTTRLEVLFVQPMKDRFEPIYQSLLVERNQNWMHKLQELMKTPETELVLVGTAHMIGQDGLLSLLAKKGYRISQLE